MLEEDKVRDTRDSVAVEEVPLAQTRDKCLHILQTKGGHTLLIICDEDHLEEVNEFVVRNTL
mgnify:FL=1